MSVLMPLARTNDLVIQEHHNECLIYDLISHKAFCLNETSAIIWELCDGNKSIADMSQELSKKLNAPVDEGLVWLALVQLKKEKLIENEVITPSDYEGLTRREIIKKVGLTSMIALPIVASLVAPAAAVAASACIPFQTPGTACVAPTSTPAASRCCPGSTCVTGLGNVMRCCSPTSTGVVVNNADTGGNINAAGSCASNNPTVFNNACNSQAGPRCCSGHAVYDGNGCIDFFQGGSPFSSIDCDCTA